MVVPGSTCALNLNLSKYSTKQGAYFSSALGYIRSNIGRTTCNIIAKNGNKYLIRVSVDGKQDTQSTKDGFIWLNNYITEALSNLFGTSITVKFTEDAFGVFRYCTIMSDAMQGYLPAVFFDASESPNGKFKIGRFYEKNGAYGSYPNKDLTVGRYGFDIYIKCTIDL